MSASLESATVFSSLTAGSAGVCIVAVLVPMTSAPRVGVAVAEAVDHGAEFRGGEARDLADVEAGAGESGESGEAVDFFVGVESALGEAAAGLDGGVAFLPHADKVRAEPCAEGDGLHVVERFHGKRGGRDGSVEGVARGVCGKWWRAVNMNLPEVTAGNNAWGRGGDAPRARVVGPGLC